MRELSKEMQMAKNRMKIMAVLMLIVAPVLYLMIAGIFEIVTDPIDDIKIVIYFLLIFLAVAPLMIFSIEKSFIAMHKKTDPTFLKRAKLYATISMIKYGVAEACYLFGFFIYIMSGTLDYMPYFYIIGIVWSYIFWPRESSLENFMKKVEDHAPPQSN